MRRSPHFFLKRSGKMDKEYEDYCNKNYPKDDDGEWVRAMHQGDRPGNRFSDGTLIDPDNPDHCSHPF